MFTIIVLLCAKQTISATSFHDVSCSFLCDEILSAPATGQLLQNKYLCAGIVHPLVRYSKQETATNFDGYHIVSLPTGINI